MQKTSKSALGAVAIILVTIGLAGVTTTVPASAQASSGQFNPQTQFAVGAKLQITSIYGLETIPPPSTINAGFRYSDHTGAGGNDGNPNQASHTGQLNQQWNLTYLRNTPTANSSITLNVQVTNDTQDGGILWTVQGGSIAYNGTTLTVTSGRGGIGKLNRVLTVGNATDSNGKIYRWTLEGLTTLYSGTVILSLTGNVVEVEQNTTPTTTTPRYQGLTLLRGVDVTYLATIS